MPVGGPGISTEMSLVLPGCESSAGHLFCCCWDSEQDVRYIVVVYVIEVVRGLTV